MHKVHFLLLFIFVSFLNIYSQDCIDFHRTSCPKIEPNPYKEFPEGSKSMLLYRGEIMDLTFSIHQGRDYRISLCSSKYPGEVVIKIWDGENPSLLLYDNTLNDMKQEFEFQVMQSRTVVVKVYIPEITTEIKNTGFLTEKIIRGCVGLLTETMVTRR